MMKDSTTWHIFVRGATVLHITILGHFCEEFTDGSFSLRFNELALLANTSEIRSITD